MDAPRPKRRTDRLSVGRISVPKGRYFLTICTENREPVLTSYLNLGTVRSALHAAFDGNNELHAACVMPDHLHLLFTLGRNLSVGRLMGKLKTQSRSRPTREAAPTWRWQRNGFEHRLRETENEADYAFYMFMNPYRAGLIPMTDKWSGWICDDPDRYDFLSSLNPDSSPPSEWLDRLAVVEGTIARSGQKGSM